VRSPAALLQRSEQVVLGSAIQGRCGASIITKLILVLDLDVAPSRHGDGSQKAQRLWARLTEPAKTKLGLRDTSYALGLP